MLKGFRDFLMRGNVLDLAVAVVIGAAFTAVIGKVVEGFINPLVAAIFGKPDLSKLFNFTIGQGEFNFGVILTALINFVLVAAVVYFALIVPVTKAREKFGPTAAEEAEAEEIVLLREIRDSLQNRS